jgi:uncharacterized repeat protein (TIGR01451 family)
VVKSVSPTGPSAVGATLTYALTVTATGNAAQTGVTVSDVLPGYRTGTASGTTTYVVGSATCSGSGTCTTTYDPATHQVTWGLGALPAGTSRSVSFRVTIDRPTPASDGGIPAFDIVNVGVVGSDQVPPVTSNRVVTPVAAVEGVKVGRTGTGSSPRAVVTVLPHTGPGVRLGVTLGVAALLLLAGLGLAAARLGVGLALGLLQPALAGQGVVAGELAGKLLRLARDLAGNAPGGLFGVVSLRLGALPSRVGARLPRRSSGSSG